MASDNSHWRRLERLYRGAPINEYFQPTITVRDGEADVGVVVRPDFFHAAAAIHGAVYFKLIDDAAFFAVASRVSDVFVLTAQLTVNFAKPVTAGRLTAFGKVTAEEGRHFKAEASIVDENGTIVGSGSGVFVRSKIPLAGIREYAEDLEGGSEGPGSSVLGPGWKSDGRSLDTSRSHIQDRGPRTQDPEIYHQSYSTYR